MSEGAGVLVLESEEHAARRSAPAIAELAGWGSTSDVHHITAPDPEGISAAKAIELALEMSGERPDAVGYINAHGTSTPLNDPTETKAIRRALGNATDGPAVSSTKSMLGHQLGAAGAVEAGITALAVREGRLPPTLNVDRQDPACDLDVVRHEPRTVPDLRLALSNAFAFGGQNVVLALRKWTG
jgi:3-oxoacyl-[acyl-carrier-protein] synthase II